MISDRWGRSPNVLLAMVLTVAWASIALPPAAAEQGAPGAGAHAVDAQAASQDAGASGPEVLLLQGSEMASLWERWAESPAAEGIRWRREDVALWERSLAEVGESAPVAVLAPVDALPDDLVVALTERHAAPVFWFDAREDWEERAPHFWRVVVGPQELRDAVVAHVRDESGSGGLALVLREGDAWAVLLADLLRDLEGSGQQVRAIHWWQGRPGEASLSERVAHPSSEGLASSQQPWREVPARAPNLRGPSLLPDVVLVLASGQDRERILEEMGRLSGAEAPLLLVLEDAWSVDGGDEAGGWAGLVALEACDVVEDVEERLEALGLDARMADAPAVLRMLDGLQAVTAFVLERASVGLLDGASGELAFTGFCGARSLEDSRVLRGRGVVLVEMGADGRWAPLGDEADAR